MSDFSLKALKGGIREYINILISIYYLYDNKSNIGYLNELYNELENVDNYKDLDIIKKNIIKIQDETTIDLNNKIVSDRSKLNRELTSRELFLILVMVVVKLKILLVFLLVVNLDVEKVQIQSN